MKNIGVPKEIKQDEHRVSLVPAVVEELSENGNNILVEKSAGQGSGITDQEYKQAGATLVNSAEEVWEKSDIVVKVKEPVKNEPDLIRENQVVFTFFHFAASRELTTAMQDSGSICIAYETIESDDGKLPILTPMSEVAGRMAVQEGAKYLEKPQEGRGILLGGVPGVEEANVLIIGGGIVGANAAKVAAGLGARVLMLDINLERLRYLEDIMPSNVSLLVSNALTIREKLQSADLVIGAVLTTGARAPVLVKKEHLPTMKDGSVIVDVAVDQGGSVETAKPTTHKDPIYIVDGVVHYCVTNMPGAVGRTSTYALSNATWPYLSEITNQGWKKAAANNQEIARGLNIVNGDICHKAVASSHDLPYTPIDEFIET